MMRGAPADTRSGPQAHLRTRGLPETLRIEHKRLLATVILHGRHRCVEVLDGAIERRREPEQPRARCEISDVAHAGQGGAP